MKTVEITYGDTGQIIDFYPPETETIPSSVTANVYWSSYGNDDTAEFTPAVSVDSVSTAVNTASGYSQSVRSRVYLGTTSGIVIGRQYLLANASTQREIVTPVNIGSTYIDTLDELQNDYASSALSTFKGTRCYFTIDATWVATEDHILDADDLPYRVVWQYTVNSIPRRATTYLRLVRKQSKHNITVKDIEDLLPNVLAEESPLSKGLRCQSLIDRAWNRVRLDLLSQDVDPTAIASTEILDEIVKARVLVEHAIRRIANGNNDALAYHSLVSSEYDKLFGKMIATMKAPLETSSDGDTTSPRNLSMWFQS